MCNGKVFFLSLEVQILIRDSDFPGRDVGAVGLDGSIGPGFKRVGRMEVTLVSRVQLFRVQDSGFRVPFGKR